MGADVVEGPDLVLCTAHNENGFATYLVIHVVAHFRDFLKPAGDLPNFWPDPLHLESMELGRIVGDPNEIAADDRLGHAETPQGDGLADLARPLA